MAQKYQQWQDDVLKDAAMGCEGCRAEGETGGGWGGGEGGGWEVGGGAFLQCIFKLLPAELMLLFTFLQSVFRCNRLAYNAKMKRYVSPT